MDNMQERLNKLYTEYFSSSPIKTDLALRLSCPLLLAVEPCWERSARRLLIVGQETLRLGWSWYPRGHPRRPEHERYCWPHPKLESLADVCQYEHSVEALVSGYHWAIHKNPPAQGGPFWNAFHLLREGTNSVPLWTNLLRCSMESGSVIRATKRGDLAPRDLERILNFQKGLLAREIRIIDPTAVVSFTGPDYDLALREDFPRAEFVSMNNHPIRELARIVDAGLPPHSFRTYHPSYLRRSRKWHFIEEIANAIAAETD